MYLSLPSACLVTSFLTPFLCAAFHFQLIWNTQLWKGFEGCVRDIHHGGCGNTQRAKGEERQNANKVTKTMLLNICTHPGRKRIAPPPKRCQSKVLSRLCARAQHDLVPHLFVHSVELPFFFFSCSIIELLQSISTLFLGFFWDKLPTGLSCLHRESLFLHWSLAFTTLA